MDEFGVLVESIGFKAQGRSAPMADLKGKSNTKNGVSGNLGINLGFDAKPSTMNRSKSAYNSNSVNGAFVGDLDDIFQSSNNFHKSQSHGGFDGLDDGFGEFVGNSKPMSGGNGGSMLDLDSMFKRSNNFKSNASAWNTYDDDDIFGGMPGLKSSAPAYNDNVFGSMASPPKQSSPVDDLLGNFGEMGLKSKTSSRYPGNAKKNAPSFDDLIPGFGGSSPPQNRANSMRIRPPQSSGGSTKSTSTSAGDPFVVLESSAFMSSSTASGKFSDSSKKDAGKNSVFSSIDELENFASGKVQKNANGQPDFLFGDGKSDGENDLDSFFGPSVQRTSVPGSGGPVDPIFDALYSNRRHDVQKSSAGTSSRENKAHPVTNVTDDFSFMFEAASSIDEFKEIEGESEERRRARLNRHLRGEARAKKVLDEKNNRDFQAQQEQEEKHRLAETLDGEVKRWAAGKEGNLRALLSSLQNVLWPECGWQPVSLTDLITSISVKKVYHKAALCVHPDKVQQRGATIRQKYIAEKVFDLLKEAWNKFNSEEL